MIPIIVTISRQLGSGGACIGQQVARRLGVKYLDRQILREAADILQEDAGILEKKEERLSSFTDNFLRILSLEPSDEVSYKPLPFRVSYDKHIFNIESEIIRNIADKESAVIVGRAGFHVLKGRVGVVNVFLHADPKIRRKRVMEVYSISNPHEADRMIADSDSSRRKFIEKMTGERWTDALVFHLCLDTGIIGYAGAVDAIVAVVTNIREGALEQEGILVRKRLTEIVRKMATTSSGIYDAFTHHHSHLLSSLLQQQLSFSREIGSVTTILAKLTKDESLQETEEYLQLDRLFSSLRSMTTEIASIEKTLLKQFEERVLFSDKAKTEVKYTLANQAKVLRLLADVIRYGDEGMRSSALKEGQDLLRSCLQFATDHETRLADGLCLSSSAPFFLAILDHTRVIVHQVLAILAILDNSLLSRFDRLILR